MFIQMRTYCLVICGLIALFLASAVQAVTTINYTLPAGAPTYKTSAAVYDGNGVLVRTLWRNVVKNVGTNSATWDNLNDAGTAVSAGTYTTKVLYHNVGYTVAGTIGNTSAVLSDDVQFWRSFISPQAMANSGAASSPIFMVAGYNEQQTGCKKITPSTPQKADDWFRQDCFTSLVKVATDGTNVYLATAPAIQNEKNFVFAISATTYSTFYSFGTYGTDVRLNGTYEGQHYPSVIDLSTVTPGPNNDFASGLAVQRTGQGAGNLLAVAHATLNTVRLYNKTTGQLLRSFTVTSPKDIAFANNGDLWVITGTTVKRYKNLTTTPTLAATVSSLNAPVTVATHPSSNIMMVADGGTSQQVKSYSNVLTGTVTTPTWTYGLAGGWRTNGIAAANDKFGFFRSTDGTNITDPITPLVVLSDGSFWVGDTETNRLLHFNSARTYLERIMFRPASYCATVDNNAPTRVFSDFIEYAVDYSVPLQTGDPEATGGNNCWRFVKNWAAGREMSNFDAIYSTSVAKGLKPVYTLSNGRTYGAVNRSSAGREIVELTSTGLRFTGIFLTNTAESFYADGSRRYVSSSVPAGTDTWYKMPLLGFDTSGNPQWGPAVSLASAPIDAYSPRSGFALYGSLIPITSNNVLIAFDPSKNYVAAGQPYTWHLGAVNLGAGAWQWKGSPAVATEIPFLNIGNFDVGDGIQYAGTQVSSVGDQVIYGHTGEFYNGGQSSQWMHFMDDGLFVGQFGVPGNPNQVSKPIGFAGNTYASEMFSNAGEYFVYSNDESNVAGVMLWKLTGASAIAKLGGKGALDTTVTLGTQVATPLFSVTPGTYSFAQYVTLTSATAGASIRYTTDGSTPTSSTGTIYTGQIAISTNTTLKAIAYYAGMTDSFVASSSYSIRCAQPSFTAAAGTYPTAQTVTIATLTGGATIRYTTDGTTPSSTVGTIGTSVTLNGGCVLKAVAYKTGMADSQVSTGTYEIHGNGSNITNLFSALVTGDMPNTAPWTRNVADRHEADSWNDWFAHFDASTQKVTVACSQVAPTGMSIYRDIAGQTFGAPTSVTISGNLLVNSGYDVAGIKLKNGSTVIATLQSNSAGTVTLNGTTLVGVDGRLTNNFSLAVAGTTITAIVNGVSVSVGGGQNPTSVEIYSTNAAASRRIDFGALQLNVVFGTTTDLCSGLITGDMPNTAPWTRNQVDRHNINDPWNDWYGHFDATTQKITVTCTQVAPAGMSIYRDITSLVPGTPTNVTVSGNIQISSGWDVASIKLNSGGTTIATLQGDVKGTVTLNGKVIQGVEGRNINNFTLSISGTTITVVINGITATTTGGQKPLQIELFSTNAAAARSVIVGNLHLNVI